MILSTVVFDFGKNDLWENKLAIGGITDDAENGLDIRTLSTKLSTGIWA